MRWACRPARSSIASSAGKCARSGWVCGCGRSHARKWSAGARSAGSDQGRSRVRGASRQRKGTTIVASDDIVRRRTGRKRGNNEGSIYLREDGRWCAQLTLPSGKRKYLYGKTRRQVSEKMTALLKTAQDGLP